MTLFIPRLFASYRRHLLISFRAVVPLECLSVFSNGNLLLRRGGGWEMAQLVVTLTIPATVFKVCTSTVLLFVFSTVSLNFAELLLSAAWLVGSQSFVVSRTASCSRQRVHPDWIYVLFLEWLALLSIEH